MRKQDTFLVAMIFLTLTFFSIPSAEAFGWHYYDYGEYVERNGTYSPYSGRMTEAFYPPLSAFLEIQFHWDRGTDVPYSGAGLWYISVDYVNTGWHLENLLLRYGWWEDGSGWVTGPYE
ncbi:MAG: hypothetical protein ACXAEN_19520, partial [Candidatus Thorarchaeota archaeon]